MTKRGSARTKVLGELRLLVPEVVAGGILFHEAVAARVGVHLTDLKCLQLLRGGPLAAGELVARAGITSGAMTRLIDRLEQAGYVRRVADVSDRRRVLVEAVPAAVASLEPYYAGMAKAWDKVLAGYNNPELKLIRDLFQRMRDLTTAEIGRVQSLPPLPRRSPE